MEYFENYAQRNGDMEMSTSWLADHLETFVKPYLGFIPPKSSTHFFSDDEMTAIKNAWRSIKASFKTSGCKHLVLPGRDTYVFEILARRENFPTIFIASCSRMTAYLQRDSIPPNHLCYVADTGFVGSIPTALGIPSFKLLSVRDRTRVNRIQIFPRLSGSRSLALKIERTPKYWRTGNIRDGVVYQELSSKEEFAKAAALTQEVYCNSVKSFVDKPAFLRRRYG